MIGSEESLYDRGWRQGTVFDLELSVSTAVLKPDGAIGPRVDQYSCWVIATQDCDLSNASSGDPEPTIEIRPVAKESGSGDWGIRSAILRITSDLAVRSSSPRLHVSPLVLSTHAEKTRHDPIDEGRSIALKTWLGLRYDRPAVPEEFVELARAIAGA
jgi:hypothetical protein